MLRIGPAFFLCCVMLLMPHTSWGEMDSGVPALQLKIESQLSSVRDDESLSNDIKNTLVGLYEQSLNNIQQASRSRERAQQYEHSRTTADDQARQISQSLAGGVTDSEFNEQHYQNAAIVDIQQDLAKQEGDLASLRSKRASLDQEMSSQANRVAAIRQRQNQIQIELSQAETDAARLQQEELSAVLQQAKYWNLQTKKSALSYEADMLDQELLSEPMRSRLMSAQKAQLARDEKQLAGDIEKLERILMQRRKGDAQRSVALAEKALSAVRQEGQEVQQYVEKNRELSQELALLTDKLNQKSLRRDVIAEQIELIEREFRTLKLKVEMAGLSPMLGQLLVEQRNVLPSVHQYRKEFNALHEEMSAMTLRKLELQNEIGWRFDIDNDVADIIQSSANEHSPIKPGTAREMVTQRAAALERLRETSDTYVRLLSDLSYDLESMMGLSTTYRDFLTKQLMWVRTSKPITAFGLDEFRLEFTQLKASFMTLRLSNVFTWLSGHWGFLALFFVSLLLFAGQIYMRPLRRERLQSILAERYSFPSVLVYLGLVLYCSLPLAMLVLLITRFVEYPMLPTEHELILRKLWIYALLCDFFCRLARDRGFLQAYLRWPKDIVSAMYRSFNGLRVMVLPTLLLALVPLNAFVRNDGGALGAILLSASMLLFAWCVALFMRQPYDILQSLRQHQLVSPASRQQKILRYFLLSGILLLTVCFLFGYRYSAEKICGAVFETILVSAYFILLHRLGVRWLSELQSKEQHRLRVEEWKLNIASNQGKDESNEEAERLKLEVDSKNIEDLGEESVKLVNFVMYLLVAGILAVVWAPLIPALGKLDDVTLWSFSNSANGVDSEQLVTLKDFLMVVLFSVLALFTAKRLPPFVEMTVLSRLGISRGGKYTITTLMSYTIMAFAIVSVCSALGFGWGKIQWAVAALSVGIGFGLQEIVANFISGLIILFERPIRVGDLVTIGGQTGTVKRIQIRATTLLDFDNKELLVPNKEFITSYLLNWTLSDREVRVLISVGIAYGSDVDKALEILNQTARQHPLVMADPEPVVTFESFGESALNLFLRCRIGSIDDRLGVVTDLHKAINQKYSEAGINIAFPQRDLHINVRDPIEVQMREAASTGQPTVEK